MRTNDRATTEALEAMGSKAARAMLYGRNVAAEVFGARGTGEPLTEVELAAVASYAWQCGYEAGEDGREGREEVRHDD